MAARYGSGTPTSDHRPSQRWSHASPRVGSVSAVQTTPSPAANGSPSNSRLLPSGRPIEVRDPSGPTVTTSPSEIVQTEPSSPAASETRV